ASRSPVKEFAYTPASDTWTQVKDPPQGSAVPAAAASANGHIYLIEGCCDTENPHRSPADFYAYTPATNTWAVLAQMPYAWAKVIAMVGPGGRIYALPAGTSPPRPVFIYTPATNTWTTGP